MFTLVSSPSHFYVKLSFVKSQFGLINNSI